MWVVSHLYRGNPAVKGYLQALTVIVALALMIAGFLCGLH